MDWSIFIPSVFVLYGCWYGGHLLKDIVFSRRPARPGADVSYDMERLLTDDGPTEVKDPGTMTPQSPGTVSLRKADQSALVSPEDRKVPMDEVIETAHKSAETSASKIRFS